MVLDLGPGSGCQLSRFDRSKITSMFGVEPNKALLPALRANVAKAGWEVLYNIVPCSIENEQQLCGYGVMEGSFDTVVCVHVLCSVPDVKKTVSILRRLLKPGGQIIIFEHIRHPEARWARVLQCMSQSMFTFSLLVPLMLYDGLYHYITATLTIPSHFHPRMMTLTMGNEQGSSPSSGPFLSEIAISTTQPIPPSTTWLHGKRRTGVT